MEMDRNGRAGRRTPCGRRPWRLRSALAAAAGGLALAAQAGGHFDVDDADITPDGRCQAETWAGRARAASTSFAHAGIACSVGALEWGFNADHVSQPDGRGWLLGPQLKWQFAGRDPAAPVAASLLVAASVPLPRGDGAIGRQWLLPLTWRIAGPLRLHLNVGADWDTRGGSRQARRGVGVEWEVRPGWTLVAERNRAFETWTGRAGLRIDLAPTVSLDLSLARSGGRPDAPGGRVVTAGLNWDFGR